MTYRDTLAYLDQFINYERKASYPYRQSFKLERIRSFLDLIGNPQDSFKSIHVAGTKGKGSVCVFCASILREAGYSVGLYTSPHLCDVRERLRVLTPRPARDADPDFEGMISARELSALAGSLRPAIDSFCSSSPYGPLSFFEVYTAFAFEFFRRKKIDVAVLETGLGGRLDATNVVRPLACAITTISFDHTDKLGTTLPEIAREKAGIIKGRAQGVLPVISAPQRPAALAVLSRRCRSQEARLFVVGRDIKLSYFRGNKGFQRFSIAGPLGDYRGLRIGLLGEHQAVNACVATGLAAAAAREGAYHVDGNAVRGGLSSARWPGRFETIMRDPLIILDGAHNADSAAQLARAVRQFLPGKKVSVIIGVSRDKDLRGICRNLLPVAGEFIATAADNPRAFSPNEVAACIAKEDLSKPVEMSSSVREALKLALGKRRGCFLVTGSIFVVGEARGLLALKRGNPR